MRNMKLGYYGAKLIASFEFPHGIQTRPERDALGIPTIMGMIELPDGRKVTMDMEFGEAEIVDLYGETKAEFVECVNRALKIDVNQHQFDALVAMAYNTGKDAFSDEPNNTVLRKTNKGEFDNAAAAFGRWTYGTLRGGRPGPDGKPARGPDGVELAKGQIWKKAFRGLYRRHTSEALLYCSLDWERAASDENIELTKRTEARPFGFYDIVKFKTPWKKIKDDAKYDVLQLDPVEPENWVDDIFEGDENDPSPSTPMTTEDANFMALKELGSEIKFEDFQEMGKKAKFKGNKVVIVPDTGKNDVLMEDSKTFDGLATERIARRGTVGGGAVVVASTAGAVANGLTETTQTVKEMTQTSAEVRNVATDASDLVLSFTMQQLLMTGFVIGGTALVIYGVRWWIGKNKAYEGRMSETNRAKV